MAWPYAHDPDAPGTNWPEPTLGDHAWIDSRTGRRCAVIRADLGFWTGYVSVTPDHPLFGLHYADRVRVPPKITNSIQEVGRDIGIFELFIEAFRASEEGVSPVGMMLPAHGGITYSALSAIDENWWFGFDCAHSGDLIPALALYPGLDGVFRTRDYVMGICTRLAWALDEWKDVVVERVDGNSDRSDVPELRPGTDEPG